MSPSNDAPRSHAARAPIDTTSTVSQRPSHDRSTAPLVKRDSHRSITAGVCERFAPQVERVLDEPLADADEKRGLEDVEKTSEDEAAAPAVDVLPSDATDYPDGGVRRLIRTFLSFAVRLGHRRLLLRHVHGELAAFAHSFSRQC